MRLPISFQTLPFTGNTRFANVDYALARAIRQRCSGEEGSQLREEEDDVDHCCSYDSACQYWVNCHKRFLEFLPDVAHIIQRVRWVIPAVHINDHKDDCMYNFASAYKEAIAHFHGETAEQFWPEANQAGSQVKQMNQGNRQDTLSDHSGDWNWKKMMNQCEDIFISYIYFFNDACIAITLANDLENAQRMYVQKREHFVGLSSLHAQRVPEWQAMDRSPRKKGKETYSVYRHRTSKGKSMLLFGGQIFTCIPLVPSQEAIYNNMLAEESKIFSTDVPLSKVASFLNEGICIQDAQ
jgi:hypothetical protein